MPGARTVIGGDAAESSPASSSVASCGAEVEQYRNWSEPSSSTT
jgi:hypothetical protein